MNTDHPIPRVFDFSGNNASKQTEVKPIVSQQTNRLVKTLTKSSANCLKWGKQVMHA